MKFALVSGVLPPTWSGQAMVLYRLLQGLDPSEYCLISSTSHDGDTEQGAYSQRLPAPYYQLAPEFRLTRGTRWGLFRIRQGVNILLAILFRARQIAGIINTAGCTAVVACTGDIIDLPAAYFASRLTHVAFYPYLFDYYSQQWLGTRRRHFAQILERSLLQGASCIIVPNEFLRDELRERYGVEATVIHNSCDLSAYEAMANDSDLNTDDVTGEVRVVYTGAIYEAHYDAFRNLLAAISLLDRPNVKLHLYTAQAPAVLAEHGLRGPLVIHEHQPLTSIPAIQRQADILFLPLAFVSPYPKIIKTSAPGKMGEYLAAHRPILVHAPADSFVAWYFRRYQCGLVVDQPEPARLAQALERLITDAELRTRVTKQAWERTQTDFNHKVAQREFANLLRLNTAARV